MNLSVHITKKLKDFTLNTDLEIGRETLGLLGASGSGKSMTLRCIAGLVKPDEGRIVLNGRVLFDSRQGINVPVQQRRVGLLFQNYALFPNLTVRENISFGLRTLPKKEQERKVQDKMEMLGLSLLKDRYPHQISGGEQQRTALARTLVTEPECLLLDEPFSALDNHIRSQLEKDLLETLSVFPGAVIFVTHNLRECYRVSKKIMIMDKGQTVSYGTRDEVFVSPRTVQAARLTGCKNISRMHLISPGRVKAMDWGCELELSHRQEPLKIEEATHVGIREHQLKLVENCDFPNTFSCWVRGMSETPFTVNLFLALQEAKETAEETLRGEAAESETGHLLLQVSMPKEDYAEIRARPYPWLVQLKPEHLFLMKQ